MNNNRMFSKGSSSHKNGIDSKSKKREDVQMALHVQHQNKKRFSDGIDVIGRIRLDGHDITIENGQLVVQVAPSEVQVAPSEMIASNISQP